MHLISQLRRWSRHRIRALGEVINRHIHLDTVQSKLQLAIALLMITSLVITTGTFIISTKMTQTRLLASETDNEATKAMDALKARVRSLEAATTMLAADPTVTRAIQEETEEALEILNGRAVAMRDRFGVGLIQIYNDEGIARTNLLLSSLYRESSILDEVRADQTVVRLVADRVLLLTRVDLAEGQGAVITGIDLEKELERLVQQYRLSADVGLSVAAGGGAPQPPQISSTAEPFPFDAPEGRSPGMYSERLAIELGETLVELMLIRSTGDIQKLTMNGLIVVVASTTLTTGMLLAISLVLMRAIARPVHELAETADAIASGDLNRRSRVSPASFLNVGHNDEIGALTAAFNRMVNQLQDLYEHLEARVEARTHELATAAEVARTISQSLDLNVILQQASLAIQKRLNADAIAVYLIDEQEDQATLHLARGDDYPLTKGDQLTLEARNPVGAAAQLHSPCVIPDTETNTRYLPVSWTSAIRAVVTVPILAGDKVLGVLELQSSTTGAFSADTAGLLNTLADQIAVGIQNARRYSEEQRRRRFTEVLELTGRTLTGNLDLQTLPERALSSLHALINYERGALWLVEGRALRPVAQYGYVDERILYRKRLSVDADIYQAMAEHRLPIILDDVDAERSWRQPMWVSSDAIPAGVTSTGIDRSWMGVPIITTKGAVIGVICLAAGETGAFDEDDAVWVQAFASQAGIALENAHLYAEIAAFHEQAEQQPASRDRTPRRKSEIFNQVPFQEAQPQ
jgi:GAF domain-containing protein/HAMP domain-containing protein